MGMAIEEARKAIFNSEIPIGAILLHEDGKIFKAHNLTETHGSSLSHAEKLVLDEALAYNEGRYLNGSVLFTTLEPCPMCAGAIWLAKVDKVYFGAYDRTAGAAGSLFNVIPNEHLNHRPEVYGGIREEECAYLLSSFFRDKRKAKE
jgi:tRNA(adenine34) deaminase